MFIFNYFSKFAFVILSWFWLALIWILVLVPLHFHAFFPYSSKTFVICCCWYSGLLNWFYLFWWCSFPLVLKRLEFLFHISQSWKLKMTNNQCQQIFIKVINDQPSRKNFFVFFLCMQVNETITKLQQSTETNILTSLYAKRFHLLIRLPHMTDLHGPPNQHRSHDMFSGNVTTMIANLSLPITYK